MSIQQVSMSQPGAQPMPRVLMFVPQYPYPVVGGLERQSLELSKALAEMGVNVQAVSGKITSDQPDAELVDGIPVIRIPWAKWKAWRFLSTPLAIARILSKKRHAFDVVHLHQNSWASLFVVLVAKLMRKPVLMKMPNVGDYGIPGIRRRFLGSLQLAILKLSDGIIAMSEESKAELAAIGFPESRILAVPNGIALSDRIENPVVIDARVCRVVFVGRLTEQKHLDSLLTAWKRVVDAAALPARLELWGDGPLLESLRRLCDRLDLARSVVFAGHVDLVRDKLRGVDVFVLPSRNEGNSNALLEAMDAGLPIVATRVGGTAMQVGADGAPWLIDPGDGAALADCLLALINDAPCRRRLGKAMRARVEAIFDIRRIAHVYLSAYRSLVRQVDTPLARCSRLPDH